jgi:hypothetical protein
LVDPNPLTAPRSNEDSALENATLANVNWLGPAPLNANRDVPFVNVSAPATSVVPPVAPVNETEPPINVNATAFPNESRVPAALSNVNTPGLRTVIAVPVAVPEPVNRNSPPSTEVAPVCAETPVNSTRPSPFTVSPPVPVIPPATRVTPDPVTIKTWFPPTAPVKINAAAGSIKFSTNRVAPLTVVAPPHSIPFEPEKITGEAERVSALGNLSEPVNGTVALNREADNETAPDGPNGTVFDSSTHPWVMEVAPV